MTPLEPAPAAIAAGRSLYLKREDAHELGAFKWRGALPVLRLYAERGASTVVTASTGNHGAATAWAACELGLQALVFVPAGAAATKTARIRALGAELREEGENFDNAKARAAAYAAAGGLPYFEDGREPGQYEAYREIGREMSAQLGRAPATVVVPLGNGALVGGVGEAFACESTEVVGVVARDAPVMADSFDARSVATCDRCDTVADGLAVRVAIPYAVERIQDVVHHVVRVSERELVLALGRLADAGIRVEASAAASLAGLDRLERPAEPIVLVLTGRNIDDSLFERARDAPETFPG